MSTNKQTKTIAVVMSLTVWKLPTKDHRCQFPFCRVFADQQRLLDKPPCSWFPPGKQLMFFMNENHNQHETCTYDKRRPGKCIVTAAVDQQQYNAVVTFRVIMYFAVFRLHVRFSVEILRPFYRSEICGFFQPKTYACSVIRHKIIVIVCFTLIYLVRNVLSGTT